MKLLQCLFKLTLIAGFSILFARETHAQNELRDIPYFTFGKGIGIMSPDSMYLMNIRFRMQNRVALYSFDDESAGIDEVEARVRRLRLRFDGFVFDPRLTYVIQLSFTRGDMDFEDTGFPNIVRDAMVFYEAVPGLIIGLGQTKLPGNRQRVNSSGDLQFADRSIVNSRFNVDRDFGLQVFYNKALGRMHTVWRFALTSGEGRNINATDAGLAYTGRVEILPFGMFTNGGDYFEGDLMREPKPKVSFGLTYSRNERATRAGGTIGPFLFEARDINTFMADFLVKYNGFALASEFLQRATDNPITVSEDGLETSHVLSGAGFNIQTSYLFRNNIELALRYSHITPTSDLETIEFDHAQYQMGISKYIRGHRLKLQSDLAYDSRIAEHPDLESIEGWILRFQIEIGI
jgi:hypothetical protein